MHARFRERGIPLEAVFDSALYGVAAPLRKELATVSRVEKAATFEIRLRVGQPVVLTTAAGPRYVAAGGTTCGLPSPGSILAEADQVEATFHLLCEHSVYAHDAELAQGFLRMRYGHRAGIAGEPLLRNGRITAYRYVSGINIRLARQIRGVAAPVLATLRDRFGYLPSCFFYGAPGCGKTTLLRDAARQLSQEGKRVTVVDSRGELTALYQGRPVYDLGPNCDILTGCEKTLAMELAIRTLNPEFLLFDEIAGQQETAAVDAAVSSGVTVFTTAHAGSLEQLRARQILPAGLLAAVYLPGVGAPARVEELEVKEHEVAGAFELISGDGGSSLPAGLVS